MAAHGTTQQHRLTPPHCTGRDYLSHLPILPLLAYSRMHSYRDSHYYFLLLVYAACCILTLPLELITIGDCNCVIRVTFFVVHCLLAPIPHHITIIQIPNTIVSSAHVAASYHA
ncbi:hypothetical protein DFJ58DRAFT_842664 [Suillus subalutaceus]|uniref:uncharacterized protein n=1 Tax=Suillus subalutaceus TaxID=48586 RepID=UPI001B866005|nr:uncharacterized protein DFJ58DRAFT_842664 [Suillus subalutaceus]KAG1849461.1 hypothetical protein DFJ58DRAFT_842664 [Suillus subalutaceus]